MDEKNVEAIYDAKTLGKSKMLVLGLQHMFAMFGATVLVPAITGLNVSTTLLMAGLGTLLFHLITGRKVPAFLGSSFAFLGLVFFIHSFSFLICIHNEYRKRDPAIQLSFRTPF